MIFTLLRLVCSTSICTATPQLPNPSGIVVATNAHVYENLIRMFFSVTIHIAFIFFSSLLWLRPMDLHAYRCYEMTLNINLVFIKQRSLRQPPFRAVKCLTTGKGQVTKKATLGPVYMCHVNVHIQSTHKGIYKQLISFVASLNVNMNAHHTDHICSII